MNDTTTDNVAPTTDLDDMSTQEMIDLCKKHTMYTWAAADDVDPLPIERAEGIYFWTPGGKRFLDFNSQLMSVNVGHGHPKIKQAIKDAVDDLIYVFPASATKPRAKLGKLLSEVVPGNINRFFFGLGGERKCDQGRPSLYRKAKNPGAIPQLSRGYQPVHAAHGRPAPAAQRARHPGHPACHGPRAVPLRVR